MEGPSGLSLLVVVVVALLFLPYASVVLLAFPAPLIYIAAALIPSALLLSGSNAQQASAAGSQDHEHDVSIAADQFEQQQANGATAEAASTVTSSKAHYTVVSRRRSLHTARQGSTGVQDAPAAQPQTRAAPAAVLSGVLGHAGTVHCSAVTGPPCAGDCSSSSCPWHLPMAPSLRLWGCDSITDCSSNSRRSSGAGKRPSSANNLQDVPGLQKQPGAADAFSFSFSTSTAHASMGDSSALPAAVGLFRSFSAPAAPELSHTAAGPHRPSELDKSAVDAAAAQQHWAPLPDSMAAVARCQREVVDLSLQLQQQPQPAQLPYTSTVPDSPGPFWVSCAASAAAAAAAPHTDAQQQVLAAAQQAPAAAHSPAAGDDAGQGGHPAPVVATDAKDLLRLQLSSYLQPAQQDCQQHECDEEPCTPVAAARQPNIPDCTWAGIQHPMQMPEQQHLQQLTQSPQTPQDQQQQQGRYAGGSVTPLPFIATSARHGMCMRHPSSRHHQAGGSPLSLSSGGIAAWAQPLPSPAESPLARRLSDRNDFGLPAGSPALTELLSSGGSSRRQLRRDFLSLDTCRRSASSPGSTRSSVELQQQEQEQDVPWAGMQLRSVAHLLQQRVQDVEQQQQQPGDCEAGVVPWYRRYQLERRHTTCNALDLSAAVDRAVAAVDAAAADEQGDLGVTGASAAAGSSMPPFQRHYTRSSSESSNCSGLGVDTSPVSVTVLPSGPLHRLACCSSATKQQPADVAAAVAGGDELAADAGVAADVAAAAIVCSSLDAGHSSCASQQTDMSPWSQNGPRSHSIW